MLKVFFVLCFMPALITGKSIPADDDDIPMVFFCGIIDPYNVFRSRLERVDPQPNMEINNVGIVNIRNSVFENCGTTLTLSMADNQLAKLTGQRLEGLRNVKVLNFFNNVIDYVANGTFDGLPQLQELELSYNRLNGLGDGIRNGLKELRKLHLNRNPILLREYGFGGLSKLELLELTGANISTIPYGSFNGLSNLQRLDLSINELISLSDLSFQELTRLEELDLSMNKISIISNDTFKGLTNLKYLWLTDNRIESLPAYDIFKPIPNLTYLYFHNNSLQFFDVAVFKDMQNVVIEPGFVIDFSEKVRKNFANATSAFYQCSRFHSQIESEASDLETLRENSENATVKYSENKGHNYFTPYDCVELAMDNGEFNRPILI